MAETIGLLVIVLALSIGCWRLYKGRKVPATGLALCVLCCFIGVGLVLNKRHKEAFEIAKDCVKRYEESAESVKGAKATIGDVTLSSEAVQNMYEIAVKSSVIGNEFETVTKWARSALVHRQSPEMNAFLVLALIKTGKAEEAQTLLDQKLKQGGSDAEVFQKMLRELGVMKTPWTNPFDIRQLRKHQPQVLTLVHSHSQSALNISNRLQFS